MGYGVCIHIKQANMDKFVMLPQSECGFQKIPAIFCAKKRPKNTPLCMIEVLNTPFLVLEPLIYDLGHLFQHLNAFLQILPSKS